MLRCEQDGRVVHSGAHEELIVYRRATRAVERLPSTGIWVGIRPQVDERQVVENELTLHPGDVLLLYSDGVTEAMDGSGQRSGVERLQASLQELGEAPVDQIQSQVMATLNHWAATLTDDRTVVVLRHVPGHAEHTREDGGGGSL